MFQTIAIPVVGVLAFLAMIVLPFLFRKVVPTNGVHTVQSKKKTTAYGRGLNAGNVYYQWPSWIPILGITVIIMPTSIFDIDLESYEAYDEDRLPFVVDVKGFFQVSDAETAAQRVQNFRELNDQLGNILKGSIRTILANAKIQSILGERSEFGDAFTKEVAGQLSAWGVKTVKNIELMDLRDSSGSYVIENIMAKKKSEIEMDSRQTVAANMKSAEVSEIEAKRERDMAEQAAQQIIGERTAEKDKAVGIANEKVLQDIKTQAKITAEKDMDVKRVEDVKSSEIAKDVALINAEKTKQEGIIIADGELVEAQRDADAVLAAGTAEAEAKRLMEMAPVAALEAIAKMIAAEPKYQEYLLGIEAIKVGEKVGIAKAEAMSDADLKIIANSGSVEGGMGNMMDIMNAKGGTSIGSMLEAVNQTDAGKMLLGSFIDRLNGDAAAKK